MMSEENFHRHVLIISDIEGSSMCTGYGSGRFMHREWPRACLGMTLDTDAVVRSLFEAGVTSVTVKDFHRTGYNIFPDLMDRRANLIQGYAAGPVPGFGDPGKATGLMMIGMHAPSGARGFLPHTLTSRISRLEVNGKLMSEGQLFSAVLSAHGLAPIFFSGCPEACRHAKKEINTLSCFVIHEEIRGCPEKADEWRKNLGQAAAGALSQGAPYCPAGPFHVKMALRDGSDAARKIAGRWNFHQEGNTVRFGSKTLPELYIRLIQAAFFTPLSFKILPAGLPFYHLMGWMGRWWSRWQLHKKNRVQIVDKY